MPVGLAGSLRLFGDLIGLPYAVSVAGNARFLTDQQLFRGQLQVGVDLRAIAIPIGSYQLSLDLTARFNYFNQADIGPAPRTPSPAIPNEQAVGFQLRFGPPVERK